MSALSNFSLNQHSTGACKQKQGRTDMLYLTASPASVSSLETWPRSVHQVLDGRKASLAGLGRCCLEVLKTSRARGSSTNSAGQGSKVGTARVWRTWCVTKRSCFASPPRSPPEVMGCSSDIRRALSARERRNDQSFQLRPVAQCAQAAAYHGKRDARARRPHPWQQATAAKLAVLLDSPLNKCDL